jgi:hypothetical protein
MIETRIDSVGAQALEPGGFVLLPADKTSSEELIRARDLVTERLMAKGYSANENGALYLEIGFAARPADISVNQSTNVLASASLKRSSKKCVRYEYRLSVALTQIANGTEIYRASAGEFHCNADVNALLTILTDRAMADLGNPRGAYLLKRRLH